MDLIDGYRRFRQGRYPALASLYRKLSSGQAPKVMVVACADSRVDPATIFSAGPGDLFVVRNVANLIPPFTDDKMHHGTSAALEFAVNSLQVEDIVVMGHGGCGGISACLQATENQCAGHFIGPWMEIAAPARDEVLETMPQAAPDALQNAVEHASIRHSLANLHSFPFVREALAEGRLTLHGAWFSIIDGELHWLDPEQEAFFPVSPDDLG